MEGWLHKRGPTDKYKWERRWCVLEGSLFNWFVDEQRLEGKGPFRIKEGTRAFRFDAKSAPFDAPKYAVKRPFGFVVDLEPKAGPRRRVHYFEAPNESALRSWHRAFGNAAAQLEEAAAAEKQQAQVAANAQREMLGVSALLRRSIYASAGQAPSAAAAPRPPQEEGRGSRGARDGGLNTLMRKSFYGRALLLAAEPTSVPAAQEPQLPAPEQPQEEEEQPRQDSLKAWRQSIYMGASLNTMLRKSIYRSAMSSISATDGGRATQAPSSAAAPAPLGALGTLEPLQRDEAPQVSKTSTLMFLRRSIYQGALLSTTAEESHSGGAKDHAKVPAASTLSSLLLKAAYTQAAMCDSPTNRKRRGVSAEALQDSMDDWAPPVYEKSVAEREQLSDSIKYSHDIKLHMLFGNCEEAALRKILDAMFSKEVQRGSNVIEQGGIGDYLYIVKEGVFDIFIAKGGEAPKKVFEVTPGFAFGELALMYNSPRSATVTARISSKVWCLDRITFRNLVVRGAEMKFREYLKFLSNVNLFKALQPDERAALADVLEEEEFEDEEAIIEQGDQDDRLFIVREGAAMAAIDGSGGEVQVMQYGVGDYFGELAMLRGTPREASVYASGRCRCLHLSRDTFLRILGAARSADLERHVAKYASYDEALLKAVAAAAQAEEPAMDTETQVSVEVAHERCQAVLSTLRQLRIALARNPAEQTKQAGWLGTVAARARRCEEYARSLGVDIKQGARRNTSTGGTEVYRLITRQSTGTLQVEGLQACFPRAAACWRNSSGAAEHQKIIDSLQQRRTSVSRSPLDTPVLFESGSKESEATAEGRPESLAEKVARDFDNPLLVNPTAHFAVPGVLCAFGGLLPKQHFSDDKELHILSTTKPEDSEDCQVYNWSAPSRLANSTSIAVLCQKGRKSAFDPTPNQDNYFVQQLIGGISLYGVCDGHGPFGHLVSFRLVQTLPFFLSQSDKFGTDWEAAMKFAFVQAHAELEHFCAEQHINIEASGAAASMLLVDEQTVHVAFVGDARVMLGSWNRMNPRVVFCAQDHKPELPEERARLEAAGSEVREIDPGTYRIYRPGTSFPGLTMSRAMGDTACAGVSREPEYHKFLMQPKDEWYAIVASDGIWEFLEADEVLQMTSKKLRLKGPRETLKSLVASSRKRWEYCCGEYCDDITAVLVQWNSRNNKDSKTNHLLAVKRPTL